MLNHRTRTSCIEHSGQAWCHRSSASDERVNGRGSQFRVLWLTFSHTKSRPESSLTPPKPRLTAYCRRQEFSSALGCFLGSFLLANEANEHQFNTGERSARVLFFALLFQSPGPAGDEPWCIDITLPFDCPVVVNSCLFCCLSCPVCMEAMHRCSAMPCVPELLGGNLAPLPADKSDWHIHQFVRVHIPWHIHQT